MLNFDLFFENHIKFFLPEIYIITISLFLLIVGVTVSNLRKYKYPYFVYEMSILSVLALLFTLFLILNSTLNNAVIFNNLFINDDFSIFFKSLSLIATISCLLISLNFVDRAGINSFEYLILILCSTFGLMCLISSFDLVSMYISLEVQSLSFYILASMRKDSSFSTEAGLKYFILGAFSSGILLLGISFIYGAVGTTSFENLGKFFIGFDFLELNSYLFHINNRVVVGIICLFIGILFKLTAVPFHMWAPDVYEGSPLFITILFSIVPKIGIFAVAIKIFYFALYEGFVYWQSVGLLCSVLSITVGTLKALQQNKIKRFLAYSSIGHVGFLLIGFSTGTILGTQGLLFYLVVYTIMMINIWSVVIALRVRNKNYTQIKYITDLQGLYKSNPIMAYTLAINMFSMAGVPPLAGFFSKFYVLFSGLESSFNLLVIISIIFSVISAFYYIRFIKVIFFDESNTGLLYDDSLGYIHSLILGLSFLFILFLFVLPNPLVLITQYFGLSFFM